MSHLLLFSLGPVQDFIATARRCQDLWFGSWLLSDLAGAAARAIDDRLGGSALVVPGKLGDGAAVANEIYAVATDGSNATAAAVAARAAVRARLEEHMDTYFGRVRSPFFHRETAERQVRDLIETTWAISPIDEAKYKNARERTKSLLTARKATRTFGPVPWHGDSPRLVPKSSLDGTRESVIDEDAYARAARSEQASQRLWAEFKARPNERLSGVDLLKRFGQELDGAGRQHDKPAFHSTSHISSGPLRTRLARLGEAGEAALSRWTSRLAGEGVDLGRHEIDPGDKKSVKLTFSGYMANVPRTLAHGISNKSKGLDGYVLYEGRIRELLEDTSDSVDAEREKRLAKELSTCLADLGWTRPVQPYFAFLLADGDKMGVAIDQFTTPEQHAKFSRGLEAWAASCREVVEDHLGSCIYAGGDDVLALLPLHTALDCADRLRLSFEEAMKPLMPEPRPTLSIGLGVAHHMEPMREALALARRAERDAKLKRNSLAIRVSKRGGGELACKAEWTGDKSVNLPARLMEWCKRFASEELPDKAAFELEKAVDLLTDAPTGESMPAELVLALAKRALGRRRAQRGGEALHKTVATMLEDWFPKGTVDPRKAVRELSSELQVARLFLDAFQEAWGDDVFSKRESNHE